MSQLERQYMAWKSHILRLPKVTPIFEMGCRIQISLHRAMNDLTPHKGEFSLILVKSSTFDSPIAMNPTTAAKAPVKPTSRAKF